MCLHHFDLTYQVAASITNTNVNIAFQFIARLTWDFIIARKNYEKPSASCGDQEFAIFRSILFSHSSHVLQCMVITVGVMLNGLAQPS